MTPLVIFDCDGVLVDTEPIANRVLAQMITAEGLPTTTAESMARYMGRSMPAVVEMIEAHLERPVPPSFEEIFERRTFSAFDVELEAVAGAASAVDAISAAGMLVCVASSGTPTKMRHTLGLTGLLSRFEGRLFSASEVKRGKPFPDLFLYAADRMGARPSECVVVEDSPAGVAAACAAGMRAIGLVGPLGPQALLDAGAEPIGAMDELADAVLGAVEGA